MKFSVHRKYPESTTISVMIGGIEIPMIIDSGSTSYIVDRETWEYLKKQGMECRNQKRSEDTYAYGSKEALSVAGLFWTKVEYQENRLDEVEFVVIEGKGQSLLSCETAIQLGVLKIVRNIEGDTSNADAIIEEYQDVFEGIGKLKDYQLKIPIDNDVEPVVQATRRVPFNLRDKLSQKLDELEAKDIIERVDGPTTWVSPVVIVPKPNGDIRLCLDMRQANSAVKRVRHPIPTVDEVLQEMNESKVFSKLDISMAYHQLELSEDSRDITTFTTHKGLYRYKKLVFGVSCASEMYQNVMQQVLSGCEGVQNIMDDIIVHSKDNEEHKKHLERVLSVLRERGLTLNKDKCQFFMSKLVFMGHELSDRGIGPTDAKVEAVKNAREPQNASEVRSYLGLVNYSARFIPDLATVAAPLRELTKKNARFKWGSQEQSAFDELKKRLSSAETLGYYDKNAPTTVIVDASPVGLGAILVQEQNDEYRVISYASRSLSQVERRYSQTEREALAIVWGCERFSVYLIGLEFELLTDHKALECIYGKKSKPCARIERWVLRLQPYTFKVTYIPGSKNVADSLSRLLDSKYERAENEYSDEYVKFIAREATPTAMTTREIEEESARDGEIGALRECLLTGKWHKLEHKEYLPIRSELCAIGQLILRGTRIVIPENLREHVLELAHLGHPGIVAMKGSLRTKVWWPGIDKQVEQFCKSCYGCQLVGKPCKPEPMTRTELPSGPWQDLAMDVLGPLPSGDTILILIDYYSRYFEVEVTKSITSEKINAVMSKWFVTHGLPMSIRTDNAAYFTSEKFRNYMKVNGITHRRNTPLWPQANGEIERQNRSILKRIQISQAEGRNWKHDIDDYLVMYRSTPHSTTGRSPAELLFGRKIRTKLPDLNYYETQYLNVRDVDAEKKGKGKLYGDSRRGASENDISVGDRVLLKQNRENKLDTVFHPNPHIVREKKGNSVVVESNEGVQYRRNVTHVKPFHERARNGSHNAKDQEPNQNQADLEPSPIVTQPVRQDSEILDQDPNLETHFKSPEITSSRPVREKKTPIRLKDYVLN